MEPRDIDALPNFLRANADTLPDPEAARLVLAAYEDDLAEFREHPNYGNPLVAETPVLDGPPTLERISGRLDGLFYALKVLAVPLAGQPGYSAEWRAE
ncbi:hypothetical protein GCM10009809_38250 [Isoptericola hypogeus]|uniref:Phage gp6-like head-tail connector protein n=1 Tax=Isoptericola hypogeus TaxID=300179 RepID=A0ABN2JUA4_9MICO